MVIDIHGQLGRSGQREAAVALLNEYIEACGIDRLLVSNLEAASVGPDAANLDEAIANVACLQACRQHKCWVPLYWVRPGQVDSNIHAFAGALSTEPFAGVVFSPVLNGFSADAELLDPYLSVMEQLHVPGLFHVGSADDSRPASVYRLAKRHPSVPLVLYDPAAHGLWAEALDVIRRAVDHEDADLYVGTAHASIGEILAAVGGVGPERVLYGSDAPCHSSQHAARCGSLLDGLHAALPDESVRRIIGGNAAAVFGHADSADAGRS